MVRDYEEEPKVRSLGLNGSTEIDQLLDGSLERVRDVADNQIGFIQDACEQKFPSLEEKVDRLEQTMRRLLATEQAKESERKQVMDQFIRKENEALVQFMQQMEQRINDIDSSYERAREQVYQKYNSNNKTENSKS